MCVCGFVRWRRESGLCRSDALVIYIVRPPRAFLAQTHFQWGTTQPVLVHLRTKVQDLESERWWTIPRRKKMVSFCQRVGLPAAPSRWMIDGYWCTYADCQRKQSTHLHPALRISKKPKQPKVPNIFVSLPCLCVCACVFLLGWYLPCA